MTLKPIKKFKLHASPSFSPTLPLFLTDHYENRSRLCFKNVPGMPDADKVQKARGSLGKCCGKDKWGCSTVLQKILWTGKKKIYLFHFHLYLGLISWCTLPLEIRVKQYLKGTYYIPFQSLDFRHSFLHLYEVPPAVKQIVLWLVD